MSGNPYQPPQTIDAPPEPPVIPQTHLEQVAFRDLAEIAWAYVLVGQILFAVLLIAFVLVGVTWKLFTPGNNPNWVLAIMLGCGSILAVLLGWAGIMGNVAASTMNKHFKDPPQTTKWERFLIILGTVGGSNGMFIVFLEFRRSALGVSLFLIPLALLVLAIWPSTQLQLRLLSFLRSFHPRADWSLAGQDLRRICFTGVIVATCGLLLLIDDSCLVSIAWGWLLLVVVGAMVYVAPIIFCFRQLAKEFDKLWP